MFCAAARNTDACQGEPIITITFNRHVDNDTVNLIIFQATVEVRSAHREPLSESYPGELAARIRTIQEFIPAWPILLYAVGYACSQSCRFSAD